MGSTSAAGAPSRSAYLVLATLTAMNLLNYIDRFILASVIEPVQGALGFADSDHAAGIIASVFLVSYSIFSIPVGWLGDRVPRKYLVAFGVGVWSLATFLSGAVDSYGQMLAARAVLGIGEAAYAVLAPGIIGDLFTRSRRNRMLTLFYLAIPVGAALGFVLGGQLEAHFGWRWAFRAVGLPGLFAAVVALALPEPRRGQTELAEEGEGDRGDTAPIRPAEYLALARNRSFVLATLGMAMMSFALGGLQFWVTKYLSVGAGDMPRKDVASWLGLVLAVSSLVGTSAGGLLADRLAKRGGGAYFWVSGLGMVAAVPFVLAALLSRSYPVIFLCILAGLTFGVFNFGPSNTILVNVTRPNIRAAAIAINILFLHWLGDIPSMWLVGLVSDATQAAGVAAGEKEGLFWGLTTLLPAMLLSGLFFCWGARYYQRDQEEVVREMRAEAV
jgi:predicted MFS family arabinose efflux permease